MEKNKTVLSKQRLITVMLIAGIAVLAASYFIFDGVFKQEKNTVRLFDDDGDAVEVYLVDNNEKRRADGESITLGYLKKVLDGKEEDRGYSVKKGESNDVLCTFNANDIEITYAPYVFPEIPLEDVSRVAIKNNEGKTVVSRKNPEHNWLIEDVEMPMYNATLIDSLVSDAKFMLADSKFKPGKDLTPYNLTDETCYATVEISSFDGRNEKIYIGCPTLSGSQVYVKHSEKDFVYMLNASDTERFLMGTEMFISPVAAPTLNEQQSEYIDYFRITRNGQKVTEIKLVTEEESKMDAVGVHHKIIYPENGGYVSTRFYEDVLPLIENISGSVVEKYNMAQLSDEEKQQAFEFYCLDKPSAFLEYGYGDTSVKLVFGEKIVYEDYGNITGSFVYSDYNNGVIVFMPDYTLPFMEYDTVDFAQERVFFTNIAEVEKIVLKADGLNCEFNLKGEGSELVVTEKLSAKSMHVPSFRQFYIALLGISVGGETGFETGVDVSTLDSELDFEVTFKNGQVVKYSCYNESTTRCYCTVNGEGSFFTLRQNVEKILSYCNMLMKGKEIKSDYEIEVG